MGCGLLNVTRSAPFFTSATRAATLTWGRLARLGDVCASVSVLGGALHHAARLQRDADSRFYPQCVLRPIRACFTCRSRVDDSPERVSSCHPGRGEDPLPAPPPRCMRAVGGAGVPACRGRGAHLPVRTADSIIHTHGELHFRQHVAVMVATTCDEMYPLCCCRCDCGGYAADDPCRASRWWWSGSSSTRTDRTCGASKSPPRHEYFDLSALHPIHSMHATGTAPAAAAWREMARGLQSTSPLEHVHGAHHVICAVVPAQQCAHLRLVHALPV